MVKINLPKEVLHKESFKSLPAKEKDEYLDNLLKRTLELNPDGITISQIKEATDLTYSTIWHHLELLSSTAQIRKVARGNLDVYFNAGVTKHSNDFNKGKVQYTVSSVENSEGKFICMQEKKENRTGNLTVSGGVCIPLDLIGNLLEIIKKVK